MIRCAIWHHLHNFKNVKNTYGGVLLLVKLQGEACNFTESNYSSMGVFHVCQIVQMIPNRATHHVYFATLRIYHLTIVGILIRFSWAWLMYEKKSKSSQPALIWDENHSVNAAFLTDLFNRTNKDPKYCPIWTQCRYSLGTLLAIRYSATQDIRVLKAL